MGLVRNSGLAFALKTENLQKVEFFCKQLLLVLSLFTYFFIKFLILFIIIPPKNLVLTIII